MVSRCKTSITAADLGDDENLVTLTHYCIVEVDIEVDEELMKKLRSEKRVAVLDVYQARRKVCVLSTNTCVSLT